MRAVHPVGLLLVGLLAGCGGASGGSVTGGSSTGGSSTGSSSTGAPGTAGTLRGDLVVLAAASLTDAFGELATTFEDQHPGVDVTVSTAGSSQLAQQVLAGAPADVLATASVETMATVAEEDLTAAEPQVLARNVLVLAVPAGDPGGVTGLADLADDDLLVALCEEQVPCGAASADLLERAGVQARPDTLEQDVRGVLAKLTLGEVDAGLVYATDALSAGDAVEVVPVEGAEAVANDLLVAPLVGSASPAAAQAFVDLVLSSTGRRVLDDAGFLTP